LNPEIEEESGEKTDPNTQIYIYTEASRSWARQMAKDRGL